MEHAGIYRAVRALTEIANYGHSLGFIPFHCPKGTATWVVAPKRRRITALKFFILFSQIGLICYHTFKLWMTDGAPLMKRIHVLYTSAGFIVLTFNMNVVHQDPTIIPTLMNSLLRIIHERSKSGGPLEHKIYLTTLPILWAVNRPSGFLLICEAWRSITRFEALQLCLGELRFGMAAGSTNLAVRVSHMTRFVCTFIPVTYSIAIFQKPENPRYLTSLFYEPRKVGTAVKLLVGFYHMYASAFVFSVLMLTYAFTSTFSCIMASLIDSLKVNDSRELLEMSTLKFICTQGRSMSVLLQYFNGAFGSYTLTMEFVGITAAVVNFTLALTELSPRGLIIAAAAIPLVVLTYGNYGTVFDSAKETLANWMTIARGGWFSKYCQSFRPLRINIGSFYYADRALALTILSIFLNYSASLTLSIGIGNMDHE